MKSEKGKVIVFFVVLDLKVVVESIQLYVDGYKLKWWEWDTAQIVCSQIELCSMMIAVGEFVLVWRYVVCSTAQSLRQTGLTQILSDEAVRHVKYNTSCYVLLLTLCLERVLVINAMASSGFSLCTLTCQAFMMGVSSGWPCLHYYVTVASARISQGVVVVVIGGGGGGGGGGGVAGDHIGREGTAAEGIESAGITATFCLTRLDSHIEVVLAVGIYVAVSVRRKLLSDGERYEGGMPVCSNAQLRGAMWTFISTVDNALVVVHAPAESRKSPRAMLAAKRVRKPGMLEWLMCSTSLSSLSSLGEEKRDLAEARARFTLETYPFPFWLIGQRMKRSAEWQSMG